MLLGIQMVKIDRHQRVDRCMQSFPLLCLIMCVDDTFQQASFLAVVARLAALLRFFQAIMVHAIFFASRLCTYCILHSLEGTPFRFELSCAPYISGVYKY